MEFEERFDEKPEQRNERPKEASKNLPMAVLLVLVGIICMLLYIGWKYFNDDSATADELTPAPADSVAKMKTPKMTEDNLATATNTKTEESKEGLPPITVPKIGDKKATVNKVAAIPEKVVSKVEKKVETKPVEKPKPEPAKVAVTPKSGETYTHSVGEKETFYGIANRYNISNATLKKLNPDIDPEKGVKVGVTKLKIPVKAIHTVGPGDVLRVVSLKYHVPVSLIMAANKKTKNYAERGEQLIIPFAVRQ